MAHITLYCEETPGLKLGPGITATVRTTAEDGDPAPLVPGDVIVFRDGFASFDEAEFPLWQRWVNAPGTPFIRVVDEGAGEAVEAAGSVECPVCGRLLKSEFGLKSHLKTHAPK